MSLVKHIWEAARNFATHLAENDDGRFNQPKKAGNQFKMGYDPELNASPELDPDAASYFQMLSMCSDGWSI